MKKPLRTLARLLFLLGGLVLILESIPEVGVSLRGTLNLAPQIPSLGSLVGLLLAVITGILALAGIRQVTNPAWNIVLLILGFLAWGLGGILVILGAIVAIVAFFV